MRALDPRLLHRTRAARPLLAIDTLLGVATALAVLAQASLLALIVAKAFDGAPLRALGTEFALLVTAFALRGRVRVGDGGLGTAGRVERAVRAPAGARRAAPARAADGGRRRRAGELAAVAVDGIEALEGYFARYLPQAVLASVVPLL